MQKAQPVRCLAALDASGRQGRKRDINFVWAIIEGFSRIPSCLIGLIAFLPTYSRPGAIAAVQQNKSLPPSAACTVRTMH